MNFKKGILNLNMGLKKKINPETPSCNVQYIDYSYYICLVLFHEIQYLILKSFTAD
jgi:hypothetical protein